MDPLAALRLQLEWGVDEALEDAPIDRLQSSAPVRASEPPKLGAGAMPAGKGTLAERADAAAGAADSLAALRAAIERFEGCGLRDTAANLVFAEGDATAGLMLIAGAPSADDDRAGHPMTGPAGAYLDRMLASIGLARAGLLLSPLIPWRPPGDRPPSAYELGLCLPFLHRLIRLCSPRLIVLLGPLAANSLLGVGSARRRRGKWTDLPLPGDPVAIPALAAFDPGALLNDPARGREGAGVRPFRAAGLARKEAWADLRSLARMLTTRLAPN